MRENLQRLGYLRIFFQLDLLGILLSEMREDVLVREMWCFQPLGGGIPMVGTVQTTFCHQNLLATREELFCYCDSTWKIPPGVAPQIQNQAFQVASEFPQVLPISSSVVSVKDSMRM
jgi:hypothetical protein